MFTVKIENSEGEVSLYEVKKPRYNVINVENYEQLDSFRVKQQKDREITEWTVDGTWPTSQEEFIEIRKDVKVRYCDVEEENVNSRTFMRVGSFDLINEGEFMNIVVFAARVFIMNDEGQTVDKVDLLR